MAHNPDPITALLRAHASGEPASLETLFDLVYPELRRIARAAMRGERSAHTLQPTALVHEAFVRLFGGQPVNWANRQHFFARAALEMRHSLVDYARRTLSAKRQPLAASWPPAFQSVAQLSPERLILLSLALDKLSQSNPRAASIVDLRFFAGLDFDEIAAALEIHPRTVYRQWQWARAALLLELAGVPASGSSPIASFPPSNPLPSLDDEPGPPRKDPADL